MGKESTLLVSFKLKGEDPIGVLASLLAPLEHKDLIEVEVLDEDSWDNLVDDVDWLDDLMGEV